MHTLSRPPQPSAKQMAQNLEDFELKLAQQEIADLKEKLKAQEMAHVEEISAIKKGEGVVTDPIAYVIKQLQSLPAKKSLIESQQGIIEEQTEQLKQAESDKTALAESLEQAVQAGKQAKKNADKANETSKDALRQLENSAIILKRERGELAELKALNPKRLQTQNKNLQKKNSEANEANDRLKRMLSGLRKQFEQLEKDYSKLQVQKDAIDAGFSKLHADINAGTATDVVHETEEWQICSHAERHDAMYIVDKKTDIVRPFFNGQVPKARAIPQSIKDEALVQCERNKTAAHNLGYMKGKSHG